MAQIAVSTSATVLLKPGSLRRNAKAAIKYAAPKTKFSATAAERFPGNAEVHRHTQDSIHGYRIGYLVAGGVPGTLGKI